MLKITKCPIISHVIIDEIELGVNEWKTNPSLLKEESHKDFLNRLREYIRLHQNLPRFMCYRVDTQEWQYIDWLCLNSIHFSFKNILDELGETKTIFDDILLLKTKSDMYITNKNYIWIFYTKNEGYGDISHHYNVFSEDKYKDYLNFNESISHPISG